MAAAPNALRPQVSPRSRRGSAAAAALLVASAVATLHGGARAGARAGVQAVVQVGPPPTSQFRVGDFVSSKVPIRVSNEGRGYFNEGAGKGVPDHLRNFEEEDEKLSALPEFVDFGNKGQVVGILPTSEWANRSPHFKGYPR